MKLLSLIEGKLETLSARYPEIPVPVSKKLYKGDPSETKKYFQWLLSYYDKLKKERGYETHRQFGDESTPLISMLIDTVKRFDKVVARINPDFVQGLTVSDRVKASPKDIYAYGNLIELQDTIYAAEHKKDEEVKVSSKEKDADRLFENNKVLIIRPFTHEASCKYGAGTRWCTTTASSSANFQGYSGFKSGSHDKKNWLYYIIDKTKTPWVNGKGDELAKVAVQISGSDPEVSITIYNSPDNSISRNLVPEEYMTIVLTDFAKKTGSRILYRILDQFTNVNTIDEWAKFDAKFPEYKWSSSKTVKKAYQGFQSRYGEDVKDPILFLDHYLLSKGYATESYSQKITTVYSTKGYKINKPQPFKG